ncbi:MAG: FHA domain-containing protein [Muribaculum sp.]|nr:FHA domain-containing protein [Muribaculaceae bacterium]MCM1081432.1 FHA domain-containing protein [Muribaculum sp.]
MEQNNILVIKCQNTACGKQIKFRRPNKGGIMRITCPYCKKSMNIKLPEPAPSEAPSTSGEAPKETAAAPQNPTSPVLKTDYSQAEPLKPEGEFKVGQRYEFKCPHCKKQPIGYTPKEAGEKKFACPNCKGPIIVEATSKTRIMVPDSLVCLMRGKLTQLRRAWFNKSFPLKAGINTIGRADPTVPSDISIEGDPTISRRCIEIGVSTTGAGNVFKLRVLHSTNPVLVNSERLNDGDSIQLNFGDIILLGKTKLRFDKDE